MESAQRAAPEPTPRYRRPQSEREIAFAAFERAYAWSVREMPRRIPSPTAQAYFNLVLHVTRAAPGRRALIGKADFLEVKPVSDPAFREALDILACQAGTQPADGRPRVIEWTDTEDGREYRILIENLWAPPIQPARSLRRDENGKPIRRKPVQSEGIEDYPEQPPRSAPAPVPVEAIRRAAPNAVLLIYPGGRVSSLEKECPNAETCPLVAKIRGVEKAKTDDEKRNSSFFFESTFTENKDFMKSELREFLVQNYGGEIGCVPSDSQLEKIYHELGGASLEKLDERVRKRHKAGAKLNGWGLIAGFAHDVAKVHAELSATSITTPPIKHDYGAHADHARENWAKLSPEEKAFARLNYPGAFNDLE